MSDQVNTKALIRALRPIVKETGTAAEVKDHLSNNLGLNFATPVWDDEARAYRKLFKLTSNNPETLDVARVRALLPGVPVAYSALRDAVVGVIGTVPDPMATHYDQRPTASGDGVNTDEFIALVKQYADRYEWCSAAEDAISNAFEGLEFSSTHDLVLVGTYPQTLSRANVQRLVTYAREDYSDTTTGVDDLLDEITRRWLGGNQASTSTSGLTSNGLNTSPATIRNGQWRVTIETTLAADQLRHLGWNGNADTLNGLAVRYNGITGRITSAHNA